MKHKFGKPDVGRHRKKMLIQWFIERSRENDSRTNSEKYTDTYFIVNELK